MGEGEPRESGTSEGLPHHRFGVPWLQSVPIAVSNNIDEEELARLAQKVGRAAAGQRVAWGPWACTCWPSSVPTHSPSRAVR